MIFVNQRNPIFHECAENAQQGLVGQTVSDAIQFRPVTSGSVLRYKIH